MTEDRDLEQLYERWRSSPPESISTETLGRYLVERYRAYEIPVATIPWSDYVADDEVREADIVALYTITDPVVLRRIYDEWDLEAWAEYRAGDPEGLEEARRDLFVEPEEVGFRLLHLEQSRGLRVTVLVEGRDAQATGFRIYNSAGNLAKDLSAKVGVASFPPQVHVGDLEDRDFAEYLLEANRQGLF